MCLIASFYLVDTRHGAEAPAAGMLDFSLTGQEVSRRGSVGSDDNGHTTVVALRADHWLLRLQFDYGWINTFVVYYG